MSPLAEEADDLTTAVAVDMVPLRGASRHRLAEMTEEAELWPALAVVVSEPAGAEDGSAAALFGRLNGTDDATGPTVLTGWCDWSVVDPVLGILGLTVRATAPVAFAVRILVPVRRVFPVRELATEGGVVAITTRSRAAHLRARAASWQLPPGLLLVTCAPSPDIATFADGLRQAGQRTGP